MADPDDLRRRFADLHAAGCFVIPNPWDVGSAVRFERAGALALATTSSGLAWSLGKDDTEVSLDELVDHVAALVAAVGIPVHVDAERCYDDPAATAARLIDAGCSGFSIEDFDPATGAIDPIDVSLERLGSALEVAHRHGVTVTARAEGLLHGLDDPAGACARLSAYRAAGADVVYAPGPSDPAVITALVAATDAPSNVLLRPGGPTVAVLAASGVRRISTGGALARTAYDAATTAMSALLDGLPAAP